MRKKEIFLILSLLFLIPAYPARLNIGDDKIVKVNEKIITEKDLKKFYDLTIKQLEFIYLQAGQELTEKDKPTMKMVLQNLIQSELLKEEIKKTKTVILDEVEFKKNLDNEKELFTKFMQKTNPSYKFNEADYRNYIEKQLNITYEEYIEIIKDSILKRQYIAKKTEPKIQAIMSKKYDSPKDFPVYIPNQKGGVDKYYSILDYYERNPQAFVLPKSVELKHIFISTTEFDKSGNPVKLSEDKIKIKKEKINDIYNRLIKGEKSFDDLCVAYSEDEDSKEFKDEKGNKIPGYIGRVFISGVTADYHKALFGEKLFYELFNLQKGKYSPIMEGNLGYHIFYVIEKRESGIAKFEEAKDSIIELFKKAEQEKIISDELTKLLQDLKAKASIVYYKNEYKE